MTLSRGPLRGSGWVRSRWNCCDARRGIAIELRKPGSLWGFVLSCGVGVCLGACEAAIADPALGGGIVLDCSPVLGFFAPVVGSETAGDPSPWWALSTSRDAVGRRRGMRIDPFRLSLDGVGRTVWLRSVGSFDARGSALRRASVGFWSSMAKDVVAAETGCWRERGGDCCVCRRKAIVQSLWSGGGQRSERVPLGHRLNRRPTANASSNSPCIDGSAPTSDVQGLTRSTVNNDKMEQKSAAIRQVAQAMVEM